MPNIYVSRGVGGCRSKVRRFETKPKAHRSSTKKMSFGTGILHSSFFKEYFTMSSCKKGGGTSAAADNYRLPANQ